MVKYYFWKHIILERFNQIHYWTHRPVVYDESLAACSLYVDHWPRLIGRPPTPFYGKTGLISLLLFCPGNWVLNRQLFKIFWCKWLSNPRIIWYTKAIYQEQQRVLIYQLERHKEWRTFLNSCLLLPILPTDAGVILAYHWKIMLNIQNLQIELVRISDEKRNSFLK